MTWLAVAWKFLRGIPWQVWAVIALLAAAWWYGHLRYNAGQADVQAKWDSAVEAQRQADAAIKPKQAEVTTRVETRYVDRIKVVREKGATIIKEVPVYVTQKADAGCTIPVGFVRLHDAAAANIIPDAAGNLDAAAQGIELSTVAETVAGNYSIAHETAEQLKALQEWVRGQQAIK